jgi:hypothetical protein
VKNVSLSSSYLFASPISSFTSKDKEGKYKPFGSCCVDVFDLRNGGRHLATLKNESRVESITYIPERKLILVGYDSGELHVWQIRNVSSSSSPSFSHVHGLKLFSPDHFGDQTVNAGTTNSSSSSDAIIVSTMKDLLFIDDPSQTNAAPETRSTALLPNNNSVGELLNCGYCGVYKFDSSHRCTGCHSARFCSRNCQKKGWKEHKKNCGRPKKT